MSFVEHLEELRWVLFRILIVGVVVIIGVFLFKDFVFNEIFLAPKEPYFITNQFFETLSNKLGLEVFKINQRPLQIVNLKLAGQFYTHIFMSVILGLVITVPYIIYEAWRYVKPALYETERRKSSMAVFVCSTLFLIGVAFGYYLVLPLSINFLGSYEVSTQVVNTISLTSYINTVAAISMGLGLAFELPVLIYLLSVLGVASPQVLRNQRKLVYVILLVLSAVITPPDVVSQVLVCIPLIVLYELSIRVSTGIARKKAATEAAYDYLDEE